MLCVHKHRDTSPIDDEYERAQYDNESDHGEHDTLTFGCRYRYLA